MHANAYIVKPIDLDRFIEVVQAIESFWFTIVKLPQVNVVAIDMNERPTLGVLLVEDNPADARLVEILLSEAGPSPSFEVAHVGRLREAIQRLGHSAFDVILLDLSLPDSSGLETVSGCG